MTKLVEIVITHFRRENKITIFKSKLGGINLWEIKYNKVKEVKTPMGEDIILIS